MPTTPIVFRTTHRIQFTDLDSYNHMSTANYAAYYVNHRMQGIRERIGWDLAALAALPFMVWVRRLEIDYLKPARGDQEITITSFVRNFNGPDAVVECTMADSAGKPLSRCLMTVAYIDKSTNRATDWPPEHSGLFFEPEAAP